MGSLFLSLLGLLLGLGGALLGGLLGLGLSLGSVLLALSRSLLSSLSILLSSLLDFLIERCGGFLNRVAFATLLGCRRGLLGGGSGRFLLSLGGLLFGLVGLGSCLLLLLLSVLASFLQLFSSGLSGLGGGFRSVCHRTLHSVLRLRRLL